MSAGNWLTKLRSEGYRLTDARRAVVETVAQSPRALMPAEVYTWRKNSIPCWDLLLFTARSKSSKNWD